MKNNYFARINPNIGDFNVKWVKKGKMMLFIELDHNFCWKFGLRKILKRRKFRRKSLLLTI